MANQQININGTTYTPVSPNNSKRKPGKKKPKRDHMGHLCILVMVVSFIALYWFKINS